jgi:hypothetical protein
MNKKSESVGYQALEALPSSARKMVVKVMEECYEMGCLAGFHRAIEMTKNEIRRAKRSRR